MRRTFIIALGTAIALATAAVAFAVVIPAVVGINTTAATFTASTVADSLRKRDCAVDKTTYEITDGRYTGRMIATSNPVLAGPLTIHARTTYSTSTTPKVGYVEGSFRVNDGDSRLRGTVSGTLKDGQFVGFIWGTSRGNHAKVLGNVSAAFDPRGTGFAGGALGSGDITQVAVIAGPICKGKKNDHESSIPKPDKPARPLSAEGTATIIPPVTPAVLSTITVTKHGTTTPPCVIPAGFSIPTGVVTGAKVEMRCESAVVGTATVWTLTKLKLHH